MVKQVQKIVYHGLQDVLTQRLNSGHTGYESGATKWTGETSFVFTPKRDTTVLAAGNDPAWGEIQGPVLGDVELKLYSLPLEDMPSLLGVQYSESDGVCVGDEDDYTPYVGLSLNNKVKSSSGNSYNKTILYKVRFDLPEVSNKTKAEGDTAVADVTLKGKAYPVFFTKTNGEQGARTYCFVNSAKNATKYAANENGIVYPSEFTPHSHTWGDWVDAGNGYHVRVCSTCGETETEAHSYSNGVCEVCSAVEPGSGS